MDVSYWQYFGFKGVVIVVLVVPLSIFIIYLGIKGITRQILYVNWSSYSLTERNYRIGKVAVGFWAIILGIFYILLGFLLLSYFYIQITTVHHIPTLQEQTQQLIQLHNKAP